MNALTKTPPKESMRPRLKAFVSHCESSTRSRDELAMNGSNSLTFGVKCGSPGIEEDEFLNDENSNS